MLNISGGGNPRGIPRFSLRVKNSYLRLQAWLPVLVMESITNNN